MVVTLYYMPGSSPCRAVLLGAKHFGVEMELKLVNLMAGEHMTPEFLAMNPQHTIPTVDDNGFYLTDSRATLQYFANQYGSDESAYPKDPKERYQVDKLLQFDAGVLYDRFGAVFYPIMFSKAKLDAEKVKKLDEALGFLETFLGDNKYATGDNLTIADLAFAATLATIESVGHDTSAFEKVNTYFNRLKEDVQGYAELNQQGADQFGQWFRSMTTEG